VKNITANNEEESIFPDGTIHHMSADGTKTVQYPNGKQVRTKSLKYQEVIQKRESTKD
jgi:hypothetical protein